ncbi:ScbR family autoregulator-binding transcription factor [Streptomyces spiramenti]|uniref:TetR/AcrR family transcriptional regulator n=1 Tax=Streptomyces spiramenti TaxID=2720606 RepID=A0ABX1AND8_9ACTN|nr:ScbR family autoregulator-binding transcription factor [Streptomyces spiramenti]NJP66153.1 TetR/AcrR family transcriptional regulator [Streptomyces spiramenti]
MARVRQERAERTRRALITAAAELFDQRGYHGVGLNAILRRAGVTTGAMYFHFASKEDLARAVIIGQADGLDLEGDARGLQQLVDLCQHIAVTMRSDVLLRAGVRLAVEQSEADLLDYSIYGWWSSRFAACLETAREMGQLRPGVDVDTFARVIVASFTGTQTMSRLSNSWSDLPDRIEEMLCCLLPALASEEVLATLTVSGAPFGEALSRTAAPGSSAGDAS